MRKVDKLNQGTSEESSNGANGSNKRFKQKLQSTLQIPTKLNKETKNIFRLFAIGCILYFGTLIHKPTQDNIKSQTEIKQILTDAGTLGEGKKVIINCHQKHYPDFKKISYYLDGKPVPLRIPMPDTEEEMNIEVLEYQTGNATLFYKRNHNRQSAYESRDDLVGYIQK